MRNEIQRLQQRHREQLRWRILRTCYVGGQMGVREVTVLQVISDVGLSASPEGLREELAYLEGKELVSINRGKSVWIAKITPEGKDVCEGNAECPSGIDCQFEGS